MQKKFPHTLSEPPVECDSEKNNQHFSQLKQQEELDLIFLKWNVYTHIFLPYGHSFYTG